MDALVFDNQMLGSLVVKVPTGYIYPSTQASNGNIAMVVDFTGVPDRGIVLYDGQGLTLVAGGCTAGFGCGDPTPIGGTFSTFVAFLDVNARGDVLFVANVEFGSSNRALFFYERASQTIQKVAAVGDPTPTGGFFGEVGTGSLNDLGEVVFAARKTTPQDELILRWRAGTPLTKAVASGDPTPNGETFSALIFMTQIVPIWPPHLAADGRLLFKATYSYSGGGSNQGIFEEHNGQIIRIVNSGDPGPGGGILSSLYAPISNSRGELAFTARHSLFPMAPSTWFRGRPGQWERVLGAFDVIDGKTVTVLPASLCPFRPFDDAGNLLLPLWLRDPTTGIDEQTIVLARRGHAPEILLQSGDPTPLGPITFVAFAQACMTPTSVGLVGMEVMTPSGPVDVHMRIDICVPPDATTYCTAKLNSAGCTPRIAATGIPSASAQGGFVVQSEQVLNSKPGLLFYSVSGSAAIPFAGGTLCVKPPLKRAVPVSSGGSPPPAVDCSGVFRLDMNSFAAGQLGGSPGGGLSVPGTSVYCQWYGRDPGFPQPFNVQLSDAIEYRVVP